MIEWNNKHINKLSLNDKIIRISLITDLIMNVVYKTVRNYNNNYIYILLMKQYFEMSNQFKLKYISFQHV